MKILKKIMFLVMATAILAVSSCSNSDDSPAETPSIENFIKFKYNGTVYSFNPETIEGLNRNIMGYEGVGNTHKRISLWSPLNITTGTHAIVDDPQNMETTYAATFSFLPTIDNADATSGTMVITLVTNDVIEGTFNFTGTANGETFSVTEGSFRASN